MSTDLQKDTMPTAKIIYILLLISTLVGITGIIALIMAYVVKDENSQDWLQTHYRFQIRTYWIGLLYFVTGVILLSTFFGYLMFLFVFVWMIMRCARGLIQLEKNQPVRNLESWWFT